MEFDKYSPEKHQLFNKSKNITNELLIPTKHGTISGMI